MLRNQGGPVSDHFLYLGTAASQTGNRRRAIQYQRSDFFREALDRGAVLGAHAKSEDDFRQLRGEFGRGCGGSDPMTRGRAEIFAPHGIKLQPQTIQALTENSIRRLGLPIGVRPRVADPACRFEAGRVADGNFIGVRGGAALNAAETNAVLPRLLQSYGGEIGDAVRGDISARIADFIQQLFLDGSDGDTAARTLVFGHGGRSHRVRLR